MTRPSALLLTGTGRYADPWHPFTETSHALAGLLDEAGFDVIVAADADAALEWLTSSWNWPDLLAVNVGLPRDGAPSPGRAAAAGLSAWLAGRRPLLACHSSSTSFTDLPEWKHALGGSWTRGTSMHPDHGVAEILVDRNSGSVAAGIPDFQLTDERYSWLDTHPDITVHGRHIHEDVLHPLIWSYERDGGGRTFYDALGHDAASYESPEHRELLRRGIAWLAESVPLRPGTDPEVPDSSTAELPNS